MIELQEIFHVKYGVNLELNKLVQDPNGINFVSRTARNNGVSAKVNLLENVKPIPEGVLTVSGGGSVLETFLQPEPFYSGRDVYYLTPKIKLTDAQKLYYCVCIRFNKYRYNYGRQANRTLRNLLIPSVENIPDWVNKSKTNLFKGADSPANIGNLLKINTESWYGFEIQKLFDIKKGKRLTKANMADGNTPFVGAIDSNNGVRELIGQNAIHKGNTITVNYNGSVAEAFYQSREFWASDDVNVLYPKFKMNKYIALFIVVLIKQEKYRFNYGRKWHLSRMNKQIIKLPITRKKTPDWEFMEKYIKSLPYSSSI